MNAHGMPDSNVTRRDFLGRGAAAVGAVALLRERESRAAVPAEENPWRYDVDSLRRIDPALLHYDRFVQFPVGRDGSRRLAIGPGARPHVAVGKAVVVFTETGARAGEIGVGEVVRALDVKPDGTVLVGLRDHLEVFDSQGKRTTRWPAIPGKPFLTGIATAGGLVFLADAGNRVVHRCDREGKILGKIGARDPDRMVPGLVLPSPFLDVECGADGLLLVNNPGRHKVERYTRDGDLEQSWGRPGVAIDAFCGCCNPVNLALLPDGRCVTAEKGLPRVKVYSATGVLESVVAGPDSFAPVGSEDRTDRTTTDTVHDGLDVAVDAEGRIWVLDLVGGTVQGFRAKPGAADKAA